MRTYQTVFNIDPVFNIDFTSTHSLVLTIDTKFLFLLSILSSRLKDSLCVFLLSFLVTFVSTKEKKFKRQRSYYKKTIKYKYKPFYTRYFSSVFLEAQSALSNKIENRFFKSHLNGLIPFTTKEKIVL